MTHEGHEEGDEEDYDRMTNTPSSPPEYLTVKRWVMVVLLLLLLTTFSLLLGVSMQHFQLLKKFVAVNKSNDDKGDGTSVSLRKCLFKERSRSPSALNE